MCGLGREGWSYAAYICKDKFVEALLLDEAGMLLSWERGKVECLLGFHFASGSFLCNDRTCSAATCF